MRVLLTSLPATGHFNSLLPVAEGLADAGHDVAICTTPAFADRVTDAGYEHLPGGAGTLEELFFDSPPRSDPKRWRWAHRVVFAGRAVEAMLPDLERHVERWRPDLIVRETAEFAGCLVAERRGLPHASIATGSWSSLDDRREVVADVLDGWRERLGMEPDPSAQMMYPLSPPRLHSAELGRRRLAPGDGPLHPLRQPAVAPASHGQPWLDEPRDRPLVLASLGTSMNAAGRRLSRRSSRR